mgnify:CR=1 FL=1
MQVTYTSEQYNPANEYRRYVRRDGNGVYYWAEVGTSAHAQTNGAWHRYDYRQGIVDPSELPDDVRDAADALCGYFPSYVDWPEVAPNA